VRDDDRRSAASLLDSHSAVGPPMTAAKPRIPRKVTLYSGPTYEGREALWSKDGETAYVRVVEDDRQLTKDLADGWRQSIERERALRNALESFTRGHSPGICTCVGCAALAATKEESG
jgi:hypothetical protein